MKEKGILIKLEEKSFAQVELKPNDACKKCGACLISGQGNPMLRAKNKVGAKVGNTVEVEVAPSKVILSSFLLFIMPVISLIFGYFIGNFISSPNLGIIFAIAFIAIYFLVLGLYDKKLRKFNFSPKIIDIISEDQ